MTRHFGHVIGYPPGATFVDRSAASTARVHGPPVGGIWGTPAEGASSIVLNGGYPDDRDFGDVIVYTGHGGQRNGRQAAPQSLDDTGNAALLQSELDGLPVRVLRGPRGEPAYSPAAGYRYDGLYRVVSHFSKIGEEGFLVWQFRLEKLPDDTPELDLETGGHPPAGETSPPRRAGQIQRAVRTTAVVEWVKRRHNYACQVCGLIIALPAGRNYAEGAHIKPLGRPHNGPDVVANVLCLCPNDHVRLDNGLIAVENDRKIVNRSGATLGLLRLAPGHVPDPAFLAYHRDRWSY